MLAWRDLDQQRPPQRAGFQVERAGLLGGQRGPDPGLALGLGQPGEAGPGYGDRPGRVDDLDTVPAGRVERGPQRLVPGAQAGQRGGQRIRVEVAAQPQGEHRDVLGGAGLEPVQEPQPLLGQGQRQRPVPRHGPDAGVSCAGVTQGGVIQGGVSRGGLVHGGGQAGDRGAGEHLAGRHVAAELGPDPGGDPDGQDGVAAQLEEVVVGADPPGGQDLGPDPGDGLLGAGPRGDVGAGRAAPLGGGQGAAVELAVGVQRQPVQPDERGRDHVVGQRPGQLLTQCVGSQGIAPGCRRTARCRRPAGCCRAGRSGR